MKRIIPIRKLLLGLLVCLTVASSQAFSAVSTVNFVINELVLPKEQAVSIHVHITDGDGADVSDTAVTLSILSGSGNIDAVVVTTDALGLARFGYTAPAFVTTTIFEAYSQDVTSATTCTVNVMVATPAIQALSTPTSSLLQVINGAKTIDVATINVTCNTAASVSAVIYPTATSWRVTIDGMAEGINTLTVNAVDVSGNQSLDVTAGIIIDTVSPSIVLNYPTSNGYDNGSLYIEYTLSERCSSGQITLVFSHRGGNNDPNAPHTVTHNLPVLSGVNTANLNGNDLLADNENTLTDTLVDGGVYSVTISAIDLAGNTSNIFICPTFNYDITTPAPASLLITTAYPGVRVSLSWTASPSDDVQEYHIYRGFSAASITNNIGATGNTLYQDTSVVPSVNNYYQVVAVDRAGNLSTSTNSSSVGHIRLAKTSATSKGGQVSQPVPGASITYTINYANIGYGLVDNITISDLVPTQNTIYKPGSISSSVLCSYNYQHVPNGVYNTNELAPIVGLRWTAIPTMNAGEERTVSYTVIIK